jgi:hypothetical protein
MDEYRKALNSDRVIFKYFNQAESNVLSKRLDIAHIHSTTKNDLMIDEGFRVSSPGLSSALSD